MPGTRRTARQYAASALAALALLALPGCYPRQSISSVPPGATPAQPKSAAAPQTATPAADVETKAEDAPTEQNAVQETTITEASAPKASPAKKSPPKAAAKTATGADDWQPVPESAAGAKPTATKDTIADAYYVQIGSFSTLKNADGAVTWLKKKGFAKTRIVVMQNGTTTYRRVQAGPYPSYSAAREAITELKKDWPQAFIPGD